MAISREPGTDAGRAARRRLPRALPRRAVVSAAAVVVAGTSRWGARSRIAAAQAPESIESLDSPGPPAGEATAEAAPGDEASAGEDRAPAAAPAAAAESGAGPAVALTFDAGADRGHAAGILDALTDLRVPATFGITGRWAAASPDLVRRAAGEGHLVINHTLDHRSFTGVSDRRGGLSPAQRRRQLEAADELLAPLVGGSTRPWYRLPYGDTDARVAADVAPAGYTRHAGWSVGSLGWQGLGAGAIVARCLRLAAPGAVFLLHVGAASHDGPALPALVAGLRERGFGFLRVDERA